MNEAFGGEMVPVEVLARLDSDTLVKYRVQQTRGSARWMSKVRGGRRGARRVIGAYVAVSACPRSVLRPANTSAGGGGTGLTNLDGFERNRKRSSRGIETVLASREAGCGLLEPMQENRACK
jgi:hypothetical protein